MNGPIRGYTKVSTLGEPCMVDAGWVDRRRADRAASSGIGSDTDSFVPAESCASTMDG